MKAQRRAVIDVGTNSVKLLVADVLGSQVSPVHEEGRQTRLGRGFYETKSLQPEPVRATAEAVASFARTADQLGATPPRVFATSAARDARNASDLLAAIHAASGLTVDIISGEQEAAWAFAGVSSHPAFAAVPVLLLDTGGGSTEFILGSGGCCHFRQSYPLGAVRLAESLPHADPPSPAELAHCRDTVRSFLNREVAPALLPARARETSPLSLVATGGTASVLAMMHAGLPRFDRERVEAVRLDLAEVRAWTSRLWELPLAQRKEIVGLPPERADIILFGVAIFEGIMELTGLNPLHVSTRGLRFGALLAA